MFLLFDLSKNDSICLSLFDKKYIEHKTYSVRNRELLSCIQDFLQEQDVVKEAVTGIMVVVGSGSFTNTRIAVTVANTWGYALQIPLLAVQEADISQVQQMIPLLVQQPIGQYISATYSGRPNIGG